MVLIHTVTDGARSWAVDGFAFFLADHLLKPGGWMLFDDLDWAFATSPTVGNTEQVRLMPQDERETAQVGKVFDLLGRRRPSYGEVKVDESWGWAQKVRA